jgi:hypothetical protein
MGGGGDGVQGCGRGRARPVCFLCCMGMTFGHAHQSRTHRSRGEGLHTLGVWCQRKCGSVWVDQHSQRVWH